MLTSSPTEKHFDSCSPRSPPTRISRLNPGSLVLGRGSRNRVAAKIGGGGREYVGLGLRFVGGDDAALDEMFMKGSGCAIVYRMRWPSGGFAGFSSSCLIIVIDCASHGSVTVAMIWSGSSK